MTTITEKKFCWFLLVFIIGIGWANAQSYFKQHEFHVNTPNAAEFQRYGSVPVSQYTGIPNITVPLCNFDFDGLNLPIYLSYHAGGIKVNQEATWVGLGWNLNAAPIITRSINQGSDIGSVNGLGALRPYGYCFDQELPDGGVITPEYEAYLESHNGIYNIDTQPDIFTAHLMDKSVKFILTQADASPDNRIFAKVLDESNYRIDFNQFDLTFTITDTQGYVYYFDKFEYSSNMYSLGVFNPANEDAEDEDCGTCSSYSNQRDSRVISSWHIRRITSPNDRVLEFNYQLDNSRFSNNPQGYLTYSQPSFVQVNKLNVCHERPQSRGDVDMVTSQAALSIQENVYLKEMVDLSTGNRLIFPLSDRMDLMGHERILERRGNIFNNGDFGFNGIDTTFIKNPKKLKGIQLINSKSDIIKDIRFNYGYFNEDKLTDTNRERYLRLKLNSVSVDDLKHDFDYIQPNSLPSKVSKDVDFWSFYNGANNSHRFPSFQASGDLCLQEPFSFVASTNSKRGSNFEFGKIGTLRSITYPTGGSSNFTYESHTALVDVNDFEITEDFLSQNNIEPGFPQSVSSNGQLKNYKVGGLRIKSIVDTDSNGDALTAKEYSYKDTVGPYQRSTGKLMNQLNYYSITDGVEIFGAEEDNQDHFTDVQISSINRLGTENAAQGNHVGYSMVEEIFTNNDQTDDIGRIRTEFLNTPNYTETLGARYLMISAPYHFDTSNGKVDKQTVYNKNGVIKRRIENEYSYDRIPIANGFKVNYSANQIAIGTSLRVSGTISIIVDGRFSSSQLYSDFRALTGNGFFNQVDGYWGYSIFKTLHLTTKSTEINYEDTGTVTTTQDFTYTDKNLVRTLVSSTSKPGEDLIKEFYYPNDSNFGLNSLDNLLRLRQENRIEQPIYTRSYRGDTFLNHTLFRYGVFKDHLQLQAIDSDKRDIGFAEMFREVSFLDYDDYGNVLAMNSLNGPPISYVWGYEKQYPVAKIEGQSYVLEDLVQAVDLDVLNNTNATLGQVESELLAIRNFFDTGLVTTATYEPKIGTTKIGNTWDYKNSFTYDSSERLIEIRDADDLLEIENTYGYKNAVSTCSSCPKLDLTTNAYNYQPFDEVTIGVTTENVSLDAINFWEAFFGDGTFLQGEGTIPLSLTHTYEQPGIKVIRVNFFTDYGNFVSGNVNVSVGSTDAALAEVFFTVTQDGSNTDVPTRGRLVGPPGAVVDYSASASGIPGTDYTARVDVGNNDTLHFSSSNNSSKTGQVTIPQIGYVDYELTANSSGTTARVTLSINSTSIGVIGSPASITDGE